MYPRRIPGSDVNLGLAAAFVISLTLLLLFTDPSTSRTSGQWQEVRPELKEAPVLVELGLPMVEVQLNAIECDGAVS